MKPDLRKRTDELLAALEAAHTREAIAERQLAELQQEFDALKAKMASDDINIASTFRAMQLKCDTAERERDALKAEMGKITVIAGREQQKRLNAEDALAEALEGEVGVSWDGFKVRGDRKSIDEVRAAIHAKSIEQELRDLIRYERLRAFNLQDALAEALEVMREQKAALLTFAVNAHRAKWNYEDTPAPPGCPRPFDLLHCMGDSAKAFADNSKARAFLAKHGKPEKARFSIDLDDTKDYSRVGSKPKPPTVRKKGRAKHGETKLDKLLKQSAAAYDAMSQEEKAAHDEAQRQSWVRSMAPCEHGVRDWESCPDCIAKYVEITPEMIEAGVLVLNEFGASEVDEVPGGRSLVREIYSAMSRANKKVLITESFQASSEWRRPGDVTPILHSVEMIRCVHCGQPATGASGGRTDD